MTIINSLSAFEAPQPNVHHVERWKFIRTAITAKFCQNISIWALLRPKFPSILPKHRQIKNIA